MHVCADFTLLRKQIWLALIAAGRLFAESLMKRTVRHVKKCCAETHALWAPVQQYSGMSQHKPITTPEKSDMEYIPWLYSYSPSIFILESTYVYSGLFYSWLVLNFRVTKIIRHGPRLGGHPMYAS